MTPVQVAHLWAVIEPDVDHKLVCLSVAAHRFFDVLKGCVSNVAEIRVGLPQPLTGKCPGSNSQTAH